MSERRLERDYEVIGPLTERLVYAAALALALFLACTKTAEAQVADRLFKRTAAQLSALTPPSGETDRRRVYICSDCLDDSSCTVGGGSEENLCKWDGSAWVVVGAGGGGSGDITSVWSDTTGDVSALTAAAGDSLDAGSADAASPCTRSTSLPGTCTEGQCHQDTDSGGIETYVCTATNTWTKATTATDIDTSAELLAILTDETGTGAAVFAGSPALTGSPTIDGNNICEDDGTNCPGAFATIEYNPENYPPSGNIHSAQTDEFTGSTPSASWTTFNLDSANVGYALDSFYITDGTTDELHGQYLTAPSAAADWAFFVRATASVLNAGTMGCGIALVHEGSAATPTELTGIYLRSSSGTAVSLELFDADSYELAGFTTIASLVMPASPNALLATASIYLTLEFVSATDTIIGRYSWDGRAFQGLGTDTALADPLAINVFARDDADCSFEFFRTLDSLGTVGTGLILKEIGD